MKKPTMVALALLATLLSACGGKKELAACSGPVFQLNAGEWTPTAADLAMGK